MERLLISDNSPIEKVFFRHNYSHSKSLIAIKKIITNQTIKPIVCIPEDKICSSSIVVDLIKFARNDKGKNCVKFESQFGNEETGKIFRKVSSLETL